MTSEWGGKHQGKTLGLGEFSRVGSIIYDGGTQSIPPEIQIIERYASGGTGGMFLTSVPFENEEQASQFQNAFESALETAIPTNKAEYSDDQKTRNTVRQIAKDTYASLIDGIQ